MISSVHVKLHPAIGERSTAAGAAPAETRDDSRPSLADATAHPNHWAAAPATKPTSAMSPPASESRSHPWRTSLLWAGAVAGLAFGGYALAPTVKDDDGDDFHRRRLRQRPRDLRGAPGCRPGEPGLGGRQRPGEQGGLAGPARSSEPYQVQVDLKKAAVVNAEADVDAARAHVRGILAQGRSQRWKLQRAIEDVNDKVAQLNARVAALRGREATLELAKVDFARVSKLYNRGASAREEFDQRLTAERSAEAAVKQALEEVHEVRVALGLDPHPEGEGLNGCPRRPQPDLLRGAPGAE